MVRPPRHTARALLIMLAACASGCAGEDAPPPPISEPERPPLPAESQKMLRCEDSKVRQISVLRLQDELSGHGDGTVLGTCPDGCRAASFLCDEDHCYGADVALCEQPPSRGVPCPLEGTRCTGAAASACSQPIMCGGTSIVTCACVGGAYACASDGLAAVHASLVGKWRGLVTPPAFTTPYEVSLWIYPDGTYWAECARERCSAFYYGGDGPHPGRKITVTSSTPTGATADIGVFTGTPAGVLSDLVVTGDRLAFTFRASWHSCEQPFYFDLARE